MPTVVVIGTTPLPGLGTPIQDVPANVQVYTSKDITHQGQANLTDFIEQNAGSISANAAQGNPFQPDINFRGFTASPLLGTPQGISVFQDGARINEPFGDIVNWDLIPQSAIAGMQLIPGSNPAFGLNTLGGALAIYTKSGSEYPGGDVQVSGGSFGRRTAQAQWGGVAGSLDYFATGEFFDDHGWAQHNPSRVEQFFGKVGWQNEKTDLDLSFTGANNRLEGTQTLPLSFLDDIRQGYTFPDLNTNKLAFLTLKGSQFLGDHVLLGGNAYYRQYKNQSVASDVNDDYGSVDPHTGELDQIQATNDRSTIDQQSYGGGLQLVLNGGAPAHQNQLTLGASIDAGHARFTQDSEDAQFTADRNTVGIDDFSLETDADTSSSYLGVFATDTYHLASQWTLTASGRYNHADVSIHDRTGLAPLLDGDHSFSRFNPAVGLNFNPDPRLTTYVTYNEGVRPPTAIELTCADPNAPCKLPNDFLADPSLRQIVSRTVEAGARGTWMGAERWSAALYRTSLDNDIEFISSAAGASNAGYFANVGTTRRQGVELSLSTRVQALSLAAHYTYTDATFRSSFSESSPTNSTADADGAIQVVPGDRIPGIPVHALKLRLDYAISSRLSIGANVLVSSSLYPRGDENNRDISGQVPGYTLVNLDAHWQPSDTLEIFTRVSNLFDRRYSNFGILGENFFTGPDRTFGPTAGVDPREEQFRGPGAPLGIWLGIRYSVGGTAPATGAVDRD
ncbi:MAG TPA: TonB-dependent receptor [Steroidobacteraceae bacterium]|jgi:outer membrane receptor protein involved in Fe transport